MGAGAQSITISPSDTKLGCSDHGGLDAGFRKPPCRDLRPAGGNRGKAQTGDALMQRPRHGPADCTQPGDRGAETHASI